MIKLRTRASLFLIEQVVAVIVFAVCAAVCAGVFAESYFKANDAKDISAALAAARNGAETFKYFKNPSDAALALGGHAYSLQDAVVYYDTDWQVCIEQSAEYLMRLTVAEDIANPLLCELSVQRVTGDVIIAFTVNVTHKKAVIKSIPRAEHGCGASEPSAQG
ncbi:MAG: hypothetical protein FWH17_08900 [Oscillospiraceae bacterium]|nr:hypothetical protein [Oscillospiraceae bacterium]